MQRHPTAPPRVRITATRCAAFALAAAALLAGRAVAQTPGVAGGGHDDAPRSGQSVVQGVVLSATTGKPLPLARVDIVDARLTTFSDDSGHFKFNRVPNGDHGLRVRLLGYRGESTPVVIDGPAQVEARLVEDPVMMQGLKVSVDRFQARLNAIPYSSHVHDRREILSSAAPDAEAFVRTHAGLIETNCRSMLQFRCFWIRGSVMEPSVMIDDIGTPGGFDMLGMIPREDIARIEVIQGGQMIRVYTERFMEWAARTHYRPSRQW
jgi:hypothetical protein